MTYQDYQQNGELLESKFIKKIIENFITQEKLANEIDKLSIGYNVSDALSYNFYTKELKINPGSFLTEVTGKPDLDYYDLDLKFRQDLNDRFIQGIFHELTHSLQNKIVNNPNDYDETIVRVIQNGIEQCLYNYSIYLKHYDHMIIEYNADFNGSIYADNFLDNHNINKKELYKDIKKYFLKGYNFSDGKVISPFEYYLFYTSQNNFINHDNNLDYITRIKNGLPITSEEYLLFLNDINQINNKIKTKDILY